MEETLIGVGIEMILSEVSENFLDMALVFFLRVRVDENVVEVKTSSRLPKTSFMKRWKAAGALVSPKGITRHSKEL